MKKISMIVSSALVLAAIGFASTAHADYSVVSRTQGGASSGGYGARVQPDAGTTPRQSGSRVAEFYTSTGQPVKFRQDASGHWWPSRN